jgi:hypothetical protein
MMDCRIREADSLDTSSNYDTSTIEKNMPDFRRSRTQWSESDRRRPKLTASGGSVNRLRI